jgi:hypothetical protein
MKTKFLKGDTLALSKDAMPAALEIHVLQHHGIAVME